MFCYVFLCKLRGPAWAVGSYSIGPPPNEIPPKHSTKYHERVDEQRCNSLEVREQVVEAAPVERLHPAVRDAGALVEQHLPRLQSQSLRLTVIICEFVKSFSFLH